MLTLECPFPADCGLCAAPIQPYAPPHPLLMVVGEGPGKDEVRSRQFFVGKSGQELTNYLARVGISRDDTYITNMVKCRTGDDNRDPTKHEISCCEALLLAELDAVRPRFVVTTGRVSTQWFLGGVSMEQVHGIPFLVDKVGYPMVVVPAYHPAAGLRDSTVMALIMADFRAVRDAIAGRLSPRMLEDAGVSGEYTVWDGSKEDLGPLVAVDTETQDEEGTAWSVQFSCQEGRGYFIPATDAPLVQKLGSHIARPSVETILHNAMFDVPVMEGIGISPSKYVDTMVMAYLLQTEPQGLKPLAFRHLGLKMQDYEDIVLPRRRELALEYLLAVDEVKWPKVDPVVEDRGTTVKVRQPQTINTRIKNILTAMGKDPEVDPFDRWYRVEVEEGRGMVEEVFGPMPRAYLKDVPFPVALHYAGQDPDATLRLYRVLLDRMKAMDAEVLQHA